MASVDQRTSHRTVGERAAAGREARTALPRSQQAELELAPGRDPVAILEAQNAGRAPDLVPIRYGRMLASPFAFLRGAAAIMAADLAATPRSSLHTQLCGDAHLLNFGGFASPERALVFDLNDFDETFPGPFEWDVKRLATSVELAGRHRQFGTAATAGAVAVALRSYREAMRGFAQMGDLDIWYSRLDAGTLVERLKGQHDRKLMKTLQQSGQAAHEHDEHRLLATLTRSVAGELRFASKPPLLVPAAELAEGDIEAVLRAIYRRLRRSLPRERRILLERFRYADLARKVVGIGSVGTRCWVLLLIGRNGSEPLFLQVKEAGPSVLEPALGRRQFGGNGRRVVEGQRLLQAASDIFLSFVRADEAFDGTPRDYYARQLRDWKVSVDLGSILPAGLELYAEACGWTLARAHARAGDPVPIAAYLGGSESFDRAVASFATAYADLTERDHRTLAAAVASGRVTAIEGV